MMSAAAQRDDRCFAAPNTVKRATLSKVSARLSGSALSERSGQRLPWRSGAAARRHNGGLSPRRPSSATLTTRANRLRGIVTRSMARIRLTDKVADDDLVCSPSVSASDHPICRLASRPVRPVHACRVARQWLAQNVKAFLVIVPTVARLDHYRGRL